MNNWPRCRTFISGNFGALITLTIREIITLTDRPQHFFGLFCHFFLQFFDGQIKNIGIGQTQLVDQTLALHQGKIFRMRFKIGFPRDEAIEGMHIITLGKLFVVVIQSLPIAVGFILLRHGSINDANGIHRIVRFARNG